MTAGRVLIVGGGIAGLTLSAALRGGRFDVELVERAASWSPAGAGIAMQPNGMRALRQLGIDDAVEQLGTRIDRWVFGDRSGDVLCEIDLPSVWGDVGPFIGIERRRLSEALRSVTGPCRTGLGVESLTDHGSSVSVSFSDGSGAEFDLVVGADGLHSSVRAAVFGGPDAMYAGQMVWRSIASSAPLDPTSLQFWLGDGCFFGLCPLGDGRTYGFANVTGPRAKDDRGRRLERLRQAFAGFGPQVQHHLRSLDGDHDVHCTPIEWLPHATWRRGRVVLIGDAAHACSPMMGQGGSAAIEDALALATALSLLDDLAHDADLDGCLTSFVRRREPRVEWICTQSLAIHEAVALPPRQRDPVLRANGARMFTERYQPLTQPA
jgi:2-polyprenyl-6-methoxyphenol hydroxylase-like FAD-dependent oxidoreductase